MRTTRKRMHGRRRRRSPICSKSPLQAGMNEDLNEMADHNLAKRSERKRKLESGELTKREYNREMFADAGSGPGTRSMGAMTGGGHHGGGSSVGIGAISLFHRQKKARERSATYYSRMA